jgi:tRNA-dihydrouridine synthase
MQHYFAPMEGLTDSVYRRLHHKYFGGVDRYYMPFLSPTVHRALTPREARELPPADSQPFTAVPQLLTKVADDFVLAANALFEMGYDEVNLNVGCPSGTVVAKGKGSGMMRTPDHLDAFLEEVYRRAEGKVTVKTRLGLNDPEEFHRILEIFSRYPIPLLIIHPRVRMDYYKHPIRMEYFDQAMQDYKGELCYNGGLVTADGVADFARSHPAVDKVMIGMGLLANPALCAQCKGMGGLERNALRGFHDELYRGYLEAFKSERSTIFHMKELWQFMLRSFDGGEKLFKQIKKAENSDKYEDAVAEIFDTLRSVAVLNAVVS